MPIYDSQRGTLWYRSFVTDDGVILADETIRLSEIAQALAQKMTAQKIVSISNVQEHPITREVGAHLGIEDVGSTIILNIGIGSERYGVLGLVAFGKDRYKGRCTSSCWKTSMSPSQVLCVIYCPSWKSQA